MTAVASLAAEEPPTRSGGWANETDGTESRPSDFPWCAKRNLPRAELCQTKGLQVAEWSPDAAGFLGLAHNNPWIRAAVSPS